MSMIRVTEQIMIITENESLCCVNIGGFCLLFQTHENGKEDEWKKKSKSISSLTFSYSLLITIAK